jgi:hypothetical protein
MKSQYSDVHAASCSGAMKRLRRTAPSRLKVSICSRVMARSVAIAMEGAAAHRGACCLLAAGMGWEAAGITTVRLFSLCTAFFPLRARLAERGGEFCQKLQADSPSFAADSDSGIAWVRGPGD